MTLLYWEIGKRINEEILKNKRADYGKQVVEKLSEQLTLEFGKGWGIKHLRHCLRIAETIRNKKLLCKLSEELTWTHLRILMYIENDLKREFYIEICKIERWSTRLLQEKMNSMLYERTAKSKKPAKTIQNDLNLLRNEHQITPDLVFKDPYFLNFLGLKDTYSEKDLEESILAELQNFITELGAGFAFIARQKRITIDENDYYIDLLFFHRRLKCLVAIELKLGKFEAAHKGQMELYLRWLEINENIAGENPPIGLILCADKNQEHIELLQLDKSNIRVADYLTILPSQELLKQKLHQAIELARNRFDSK
jgi:predicted nuclease of restriction endonuclease-like (RecB) superfamily